MDERVEYGCTRCGRALKPSEAWVILLPHDDRRYRCHEHREDGQPVKPLTRVTKR